MYPVCGTASAPKLDDPLELNLSTHSATVGDHTVVFNRAVAASQAFEREFPEVGKLLKKDKKLPIEKWPAPAASWLTRGVLEQIVGLIAKAKDNTWALDVAIYEYELAKIVDAVDAAQKRGVKLRVIYEAAPDEEQTAQNEANLTNIPKAAKRARVPHFPRQIHCVEPDRERRKEAGRSALRFNELHRERRVPAGKRGACDPPGGCRAGLREAVRDNLEYVR